MFQSLCFKPLVRWARCSAATFKLVFMLVSGRDHVEPVSDCQVYMEPMASMVGSG
jgi:hypothetical protein